MQVTGKGSRVYVSQAQTCLLCGEPDRLTACPEIAHQVTVLGVHAATITWRSRLQKRGQKLSYVSRNQEAVKEPCLSAESAQARSSSRLPTQTAGLGAQEGQRTF